MWAHYGCYKIERQKEFPFIIVLDYVDHPPGNCEWAVTIEAVIEN